MEYKLSFSPMSNGKAQLQFPGDMLPGDISHAMVKFRTQAGDTPACVQIALINKGALGSDEQASFSAASEIIRDELNGSTPYIEILASSVLLWTSKHIPVLGNLSQGEGDSFLSFYGKISDVYADSVDNSHLLQENVDDQLEDEGEDQTSESDGPCFDAAADTVDSSTDASSAEKEVDGDAGSEGVADGTEENVADEVEESTVTDDVDEEHPVDDSMSITLTSIAEVKRGGDTELSVKVTVERVNDDDAHYSLEFDGEQIKVYSGSREFIKDHGLRLYKYNPAGKGAFNAISDLVGEKFDSFYGIKKWLSADVGKQTVEGSLESVSDEGSVYVFEVAGLVPMSELLSGYANLARHAGKTASQEESNVDDAVSTIGEPAFPMAPDIESIEAIQAFTNDLSIQTVINGLKAGGFYQKADGTVLVDLKHSWLNDSDE